MQTQPSTRSQHNFARFACVQAFNRCVGIRKATPKAEEDTEYGADPPTLAGVLSARQSLQIVCKVNTALGYDCFLKAAEDLSDYKGDEYGATRAGSMDPLLMTSSSPQVERGGSRIASLCTTAARLQQNASFCLNYHWWCDKRIESQQIMFTSRTELIKASLGLRDAPFYICV
ncbi:hypothetical protein Q5P01_019124 [Channa striata]|uniref:Uncharacterized protein n=1 Tax=Channa striata TaxID=64152 RepID=A0AA88M0G8_CHASR|nr:hypothetical protein Q5P01_019124 [Channa striata]